MTETREEIELVALPCGKCGRPVEIAFEKVPEYLGAEWKGQPITSFLAKHKGKIKLPMCLEHARDWEAEKGGVT